MTIQEVLNIKEEKSQQTRYMTFSELKDYYARRLREFNSIMNELVAVTPTDIEGYICAEEKVEYVVKNNVSSPAISHSNSIK